MIGTRLDRAGARVVSLYGDAPRGDRFHVRLRWWSCPFPAIEREIPLRARVLDVGCGHGLGSLYLAVSSRQRDVLGVDIDRDKVGVAKQAAAHLAPGEASVRFEAVAGGLDLRESFDAVTVIDVLYLLDQVGRRELVEAAAGLVAPGGVLVVKEADQVPRWKAAITVAQELVATRVLRITEGDQVQFTPPAELAEMIERQGLDVTRRRVDSGYVHPHVLIIARRPPS